MKKFNLTHKIGQEHTPMSKAMEYFLMNFAILLVAVGVYFFKIPNNFAIGGVTGVSVILAALFKLTATNYVIILNIALLFVGFIFLGKNFGIRTTYCSLLLSFLLELFARVFPMTHPLTNQPILELVFAILLPGIGAGILFNIKSSTGGTDIIAMIMKKHSHFDIGRAILFTDIFVTSLTILVFDAQTFLCSILGLFAKSFLVDMTIENINRVKCFYITTTKPDEIISFIIKKLHRGGTSYKGNGLYSHEDRTIINVVCNSYEAILLRDFVSKIDPHAFITMVSTSQIIGKGFFNKN